MLASVCVSPVSPIQEFQVRVASQPSRAPPSGPSQIALQGMVLVYEYSQLAVFPAVKDSVLVGLTLRSPHLASCSLRL